MLLTHLTLGELNAGLERIRQSPRDGGTVEMIVRRPGIGEREVVEECRLDPDDGLVGDSWKLRAGHRSKERGPNPEMQINVMNARAIALIAQDRGRWPLAGDQLFVDLELSGDNLPPGTRLQIGAAVIEVTAVPHTGCGKFVSRFGVDAQKFVNGTIGRQLNLRGINAKVVQAGRIRVGDPVTKI